MAAALACASLAACATPGDPGGGGAVLATAIATEASVQARCPQNERELLVLVGIRMAFDATLAKRLTPEQVGLLAATRTRTNAVCHIVAVAAAAEAPPGDPPEPPTAI